MSELTVPPSKLTCANGSRWGAKGCGPCRKCRREAARMDREFCLDVLLGRFNARGYTPAEWAEYRRRNGVAA